MRLAVDFQKPAEVQVGVFLGGGQTPVSQQLLNRPEVSSPAEEMGSKRMT